MDKLKKVMKELSIFGIVIVCFLGLYVYRLAVKADIPSISETKLVQKIEADESFVVYTASGTSGYTPAHQEVVEEYLTKNRSEKIYFLNLDNIEDADTFVSTYFNEETADLEYPTTYVFVNGEIYKSKDGQIGYYDLTKLMEDFNEAK